jgi:hypothetical protein
VDNVSEFVLGHVGERLQQPIERFFLLMFEDGEQLAQRIRVGADDGR